MSMHPELKMQEGLRINVSEMAVSACRLSGFSKTSENVSCCPNVSIWLVPRPMYLVTYRLTSAAVCVYLSGRVVVSTGESTPLNLTTPV